MDRQEFIRLHNEVINRNTSTHWNWQWFLNRVLDRTSGSRYGWLINTVTKHLKDGTSTLKNGMVVLDIAGGIGMFGTYLMKMENFDFDYTVLDLNVMKTIVEDYFKTFEIKGKFIGVDIRKSPLQLQQSTVDMVWMFGWCQTTGINCETLFSDIYRILKPDGIFMFNMAFEGYATSYSMVELAVILTKIGFRIDIMERDISGFALEYFVLVRKLNVL